MQAYRLQEFCGLDGLVAAECAEPAPGPREVLLRVRARSLNFRDLLILRQRYAVPAIQGTIALSDGAGEVAAVGESVRRVAVGDRVAATYFPRWLDGSFTTREQAMEQFGCTRDGMLAPLVVVPEDALVKVPEHLSFEEAATLPCAAVTAWSALSGVRRIVPGEIVLTIGTGGVALFALQFAKLFGVRTIAITSSDAKAQRLKSLGADDVVNYRSVPDWEVAVREITGGRGVDLVVETGALDTFPRSITASATGGHIALVAFLGQGTIDTRLFGNLVTIRRVFVGSRADFETMIRAIAVHRLHPVIDRVFAFAKAKDAYAHFEARNHIGKVVITG